MKTKSNKLIVVDLELTCWEDNLNPPSGEKMEIIEIGYACLDMSKRAVIDNGSWLIKPTQSKLSEFCINLTNITPELLETEGISFPKAISLLKKKGWKSYPWSGWGWGDKYCLENQCREYGLNLPLNDIYLELKLLHALSRGHSRGIGLKRAVEEQKLAFKGFQHRAGIDALATAEVILKTLNDNRIDFTGI